MMRKAQGLPVNMIVLTALALLVLVVVGAFFISGFGQASSSVTVVNATQAQCQSKCQALATAAYNYNCCPSGTTGCLGTNPQYIGADGYRAKCGDFGACTVTLRTGKTCSCSSTDCA